MIKSAVKENEKSRNHLKKKNKKGFRLLESGRFRLAAVLVSTFLIAAFGGKILFTKNPVAAQENRAAGVEAISPSAQFCNPNLISITGILSSGKATPYPSNITVSGLTGVVTSVSVTLNNIQHDWGRDIDVLLVGPNGEKFIIMADIGQGNGLDNPATLTISDAGAGHFTNQSGAILSGAYKPTNYNDIGVNDTDAFDAPAPVGPYNHPFPTGGATFDSVFRNINPNGTWSLYIMDDASSNSGSIAGGWCLDIATGAPPANQMQFAANNFNGNAGDTATVTVNRANASAGAVSVGYSTSNGSATGGASCGAGVDFVNTSGTLNFADGETSKTFSVQLCADTSLEPNETINLGLSNPTGGATVGIPGSATLTIIPDGAPAVQFCNANPINIPISGSVQPYPSNINVSGLAGVVNRVTLTLNNVQHSWASDIDVLLVSPTGRKFVAMSDVGGDNGFDSATTITLADAATNDLMNAVTPFAAGAYNPTNLDAGDAFPPPAPGAPYKDAFPTGNATFANVFNNLNPNGTWSLFVTDDSSAAGGSVAGGWCLDITSGNALPDKIQFVAPNYNRAADTTANIIVNRPDTSLGAVSVNYATSNGTAIGGASCDEGADYVSTSGTLNFADGEATRNINVQLCAGEATEPPETLNLTLSNPTGGAVLGAPAAATVTIYNGELPCDVFWRKADSPHVVNGTRTIFADQIVCVEAGATVQFAQAGKIHSYGQIRALGTANDRVRFVGTNVFPNRVEVTSKMDLTFTDINVPLNINAGGSLTCHDCNVGLYGAIMTFPGIISGTDRRPRFVSLEKVVFDSTNSTQSQNAQLYVSGIYLLLKNITFRNSSFFNVSNSVLKFEDVVSQNSAYEGFTFSQGGMQPTLLENLTVTNCARGGLDFFGGNFFIAPSVSIQNCEYPITGKGGLMPGSVVPASGNRNNWIEVGQPGGEVTYANVGLPYVVSDFSDIAGIEFLPGVVVKGRPNFNFNTGSNPLRALGLPGAPITFEPFDPAQKWHGGQFNFTGNRMDYVILDGMREGVASAAGTGGDYYIDNSIFRNNTLGVLDKIDSNGAAYLQTNLFTNNVTAIKAENARIQAQQRTNPNLFENNQTAVLSSSVPDVRFNWWNSPTGPTTPANPGGTGDRINGGARFLPFLTARPDTSDRPPVVRMPRVPYRGILGSYQGLLDAGRKIIIHWDAADDRGIVRQKILFSPEGNPRQAFTIIADNLPPAQRSFEFTVPSVGYIPTSEAFVRIVAIDEKGQEGFDDWQALVPSGEIFGELVITADVAGRIFRAGEEIPFPYQITQGFPNGQADRYIILDADRKVVPLGANTTAILPYISTDTARLMVVYHRSINQQKFFFSEPFAIRYDPRFPDAPPVVSLVSPAAGQQFAAGQAVPIQWTATDDEAIRHFNIQTSSDGGRTWIQVAEKLPPSATSYNWQPETRSSIADVRVRVVAVDRRFQNSSATRAIGFAAPANQPPTVQLTFPAPNAVYTIGQSTFIAASATDPDGVIQRVEFYADGGSPESDPTLIGSDATPPYQVAWNYPFAQPYTVTARAYDNRNQPVTTAPITVTVNPFNPAPLPISRPELTNPVDGAVFPAPANITLEALPAPTTRTIVRVEFYNGTTLVGTDTTAPYSLTLNNLPAGKYTFFVKSVADNNAESISPLADVTVGGATATRRSPFDFDGDGKSDISVFRPTDGVWYLSRSQAGFTASQFGISTDKVVPADYDGDGKTDLAVYRGGNWYYVQSSDNQFRAVQFGLADDIPQTGDFDGDGKSDLAVFRPSNGTWYLLQSQNGFTGVQFGQNGDKPVAADYDGDGKADPAVYREGVWYVLQSRDGFRAVQFGIASDKPVVGDYDGDAKADFAVYREGVWYLLRSQTGFTAVQFGIGSDAPAPGDYDGDGKTDIAVFRGGTWYLQQSTAGFAGAQFGAANDVAVPSAFIP